MNFWTLMHSALSPAGERGRLSVFIFHRVLPEVDPLFPDEITAARFDQMLGWIKSSFNVLPLDVAVAKFRSGCLPARSAAISFDDGYEDNYEVARPLLEAHGLTATFFIATGYLNGGRMWNDSLIEMVRVWPEETLCLEKFGLGQYDVSSIAGRRKAIAQLIGQIKYLGHQERLQRCTEISQPVAHLLSNSLMMTSEQVQAMRRAGMQIGAHTVSHPILAKISLEQVKAEVGRSREVLQDLLGEKIGLFAYPNGKFGTDYTQPVAQLIADMGFDAAFSTDWGSANSKTDPMHMPRFTPWDTTKSRWLARSVANHFVDKAH